MPSQARATVPVTDGWTALVKLAKRMSQVSIASRLRVSQQTVSAYLLRQARPGAMVQRRFVLEFAFADDAWLTKAERASLRSAA